jgi:hypothetical protein
MESGVIGREGRGDAPFEEHDPMRRGKMIEVSWLRVNCSFRKDIMNKYLY